MERISFVFYLEWRRQMENMEDDELRRFMYNLCNYHEKKEIDLPTRIDKATWYGVEKALQINDAKYKSTVERNQKNGKLGGRPKKENPNNPDGSSENPKKPNGSSENPKNPITGNGEQVSDNSKQETGNGEQETGNGKQVSDNSKQETGNSEQETGNGEKLEVNSSGAIDVFSELIGNENPDGVKDNPVIDNIINIEAISKQLNYCFQTFPKWKEKLLANGSDNFIRDNYKYHLDHHLLLKMIDQYFKYYSKHE